MLFLSYIQKKSGATYATSLLFLVDINQRRTNSAHFANTGNKPVFVYEWPLHTKPYNVLVKESERSYASGKATQLYSSAYINQTFANYYTFQRYFYATQHLILQTPFFYVYWTVHHLDS